MVSVTETTTMTRKMNRRMLFAVAAVGLSVGVGLACAEARAGAPALGRTATLAERGASNPTAAVDARSGAAYVAWVETAAGTSNVLVSRLADGGDAGTKPVRANDRPGDAAPHEQAPAAVAVGPEGNVYVLWQNNTRIPGRRFPASDLRLARSTDGGTTFEPAVTVNDDAGGPPSSHTFHDLAVGADGTVWVSWIDSRARDAERARRNPRAGLPSRSSTIAFDSGPAPKAGPASGAKAGEGGGHGGHGGMKDDPTLPSPEIRVAASRDRGRTFGPSLVVDADACPCCRTSMATGPDGSVYVAWRKVFDGDVRDVVVARLAPGASAFAAPVRVHADGWVFPGCPHAGPSLAVDASGRVHAGWYTGAEGRNGLWHASSDDEGKTFGEARALLTGAFVPPSQVALVADGGEVWAAWDDRRTKDAPLTLARIDAAGRVHAREAAEAGRTPSLAAAGGARLLAWHDGEAVRVRRAGER